MRNFVLTLLALAALLAAGGCVTMHNTTVIEKDGSGTATIEMGLSESVAAAVKEMQELDPDAGGEMEMPAFDEIDRAEIEKAIAPYDVKLTNFEKSDADGRQSLKLGFAFKDLRGLSAAMTAAMGGGEDPGQGLGIYDAGNGNYVLRKAVYEFPELKAALDEKEAAEKAEEGAAEESGDAAEVDQEKMQRQMQLAGQLMGAIGELDIRMEITVPGEIVSTNAPEQEGRTSVWVVNAENMMTVGANLDPEITFKGDGLSLKPLSE